MSQSRPGFSIARSASTCSRDQIGRKRVPRRSSPKMGAGCRQKTDTAMGFCLRAFRSPCLHLKSRRSVRFLSAERKLARVSSPGSNQHFWSRKTVQTLVKARGNLPALLQSNRGMTGGYRQARRSCPQCGDAVLRVHRRIIDRLYSLYHPVHRYQCTSLECGWRGNLPKRAHLDHGGLSPLSTPTGAP